MDIGSIPGAKLSGHGVDHTPHLASRLKEKVELHITPSLSLHGSLWGEFPLILFVTSKLLHILGKFNKEEEIHGLMHSFQYVMLMTTMIMRMMMILYAVIPLLSYVAGTITFL